MQVDPNHYIVDGKKYDRVTSILKIVHSNSLENLQRIMGFKEVDEIFKKASNKGKQFHEYAETICKKGKLPGPILKILEGHNQDMFKMVNNFTLWREKKDIKKVLYTEKSLVDDSLMIGGTIDLVYEDSKGKIVILDFKTGAVELKTYQMQTAAYRYLLKKVIGINATERICLFIKPDKIKPLIYKNHNLDFSMFSMALNVHRFLT